MNKVKQKSYYKFLLFNVVLQAIKSWIVLSFPQNRREFFTWVRIKTTVEIPIIALVLYFVLFSPFHFIPSLSLQAQERFQSYPPWALGMCFALIIVAMLPLPVVFIARHFNLMSDGSNKLSVSYRKTMMKDISNLEEQDEARFILGGKPGEVPSSGPARRPFLTPGGNKPMDSLSPNICYGTSYQNAAISPTTPTTPTTPVTPESDS